MDWEAWLQFIKKFYYACKAIKQVLHATEESF